MDQPLLDRVDSCPWRLSVLRSAQDSLLDLLGHILEIKDFSDREDRQFLVAILSEALFVDSLLDCLLDKVSATGGLLVAAGRKRHFDKTSWSGNLDAVNNLVRNLRKPAQNELLLLRIPRLLLCC